YSPSRYVVEPSEYPKTSGVVRLQAVGTNRLTNARHESVAVDDLTRHMTPLIDGTRTKEQLAQELKKLVDSGKLVIQQKKNDSGTQINMDEVMSQAIDEVLRRLSNASLLIA